MHDLQTLTRRLSAVRHFRDLPHTDVACIVASGQIKRFLRGETIFVEGEPSAGLCVLFTGVVHLCKLGPRGEITILGVVEPVIMFNEVAALDGDPNPVTAVAADDSVLWQISAERFNLLLHRYPQIGLGLLPILARRNRFLIAQVEDLSFRSVLARTAKLLLDLSHHGEQPIGRQQHPNHEMAARIATVPEGFSRCLHIFRDRGFISASRHSLVIHQPDCLAEIAQLGPKPLQD
jgi:CRP/FNR family transcriptional regulator